MISENIFLIAHKNADITSLYKTLMWA